MTDGIDFSKPLNPRYVNYCRAHGLSPKQMHEQDRQKYHGGVMTGFIVWNNERLRECREQYPEYFFDNHLVNHNGYDKWLYTWATKQRAKKPRKIRSDAK